MKKLIFLIAVIFVAISCERAVESVETQPSLKTKINETTAVNSDSVQTASFLESDVDPGTIVPPRR